MAHKCIIALLGRRAYLFTVWKMRKEEGHRRQRWSAGRLLQMLCAWIHPPVVGTHLLTQWHSEGPREPVAPLFWESRKACENPPRLSFENPGRPARTCRAFLLRIPEGPREPTAPFFWESQKARENPQNQVSGHYFSGSLSQNPVLICKWAWFGARLSFFMRHFQFEVCRYTPWLLSTNFLKVVIFWGVVQRSQWQPVRT